ncbi:hypothetical protein WN943_024808 [Citrus x changshan-huyou]
MLQQATSDSDSDYIGVRRLILFRKAESGVRRRLDWRCNRKGYVAYHNYIHMPRNWESQTPSYQSTPGNRLLKFYLMSMSTAWLVHIWECVRNWKIFGRWLPSSSPLSLLYEVDSWRSNKIVFRELLSAVIVNHGLPFQFVEFDAIRTCFEFLNSEVQNISRNTAKADILKAYNAERLKIKAILEEVPGRICFTYDLWTACTIDGYTSLIAHFIDKNWVLQKKIVELHLDAIDRSLIRASSGNMVMRMESRVEFVEEVVTLVQGELGAIK